MWKIVLSMCFIELVQIILSVDGRTGVFLQEVPLGKNVIVRCGSNDENHIFEYWILGNNILIGPASDNFDNVKFKYEVLSGDLTIRAVSKLEEGIYTCVSRAVKDNDRKIETVKIVVNQDWEDIYEHDSNINTIRILIILITIVLLGIGGYVVTKMWRERYKYPSYLEHEDEDGSTEEIFRSPSTSGINRTRSPGRIVLEKNEPSPLSDGSNISTDFKSILEKSND